MPNSRGLNAREGKVVEAFRQETRRWVKARRLSVHVDLSTREIGHALAELHERGIVEVWNESRSSPNTWRLAIDTDD